MDDIDISAIPEDKLQAIKSLAAFAVTTPFRTPIHKTPADHGVDAWEDLYFPSADGVPLEAWYVPAVGGETDNLIIMNHPFPMSRSGFTGHWGAPWDSVDDIEIDFVAHVAHLVKAGYNVLTYDLRNHGNSGAANGGICGVGRYEWRDCIGAKNYVDAHPRFSKMKKALYSQCTGGNAQFEAIYREPELFEDIVCMLCPMTVSMEAIRTTFAKMQGIEDYLDAIAFEERKLGGFTYKEMDPKPFAPAVTMPVFQFQVKEDVWTDNPRDGQEIFDRISSNEKEMFWIEGTTRRFDGYNYFGKNPEKMLAFFDRHMKK